MCGIAGIYLKNPEVDYLSTKEKESLVDWLYCGIEHRGTHATGIAVQDKNGETVLEKSDMPASKFIFWRRDLMPDARTILMHTRLHTKGKPENLLNNHPVQYDNIMMVHNGHISNDDELFKTEELERFAEVDSEIISALLHKYSMTEPKEALEKMSGGFAIAAIDQNNPGKLLLAKGQSSPLVYLETRGMWIWASEEKAIRDALKYVLNWEPTTFEPKIMQFGEYILIDGEESEKHDFKPYFKSYTPKYQGGTGLHNPNQHTGGWSAGGSWDSLDACDECFQTFDRYKLNKVGQNYYCDRCEKNLFDITDNGVRIAKAKPTNSTKKLSRKERKRLRREAQRRFQEGQAKGTENKEKEQGVSSCEVDQTDKEIGEVLDDEHWTVCELVAEFYGTKREFVDMILFSDDLVAEDDPMLSTIYIEFEEKYNELLDEVRDETDVVLNRLTNASKNARRFPVGF